MQSTQVMCPDGETVGGKYVKCFEDEDEYTTQCLFSITMQDFTSELCAAFPTPSGIDYVEIGMLQDARDGKWYEVRKFVDGVCWMVDNLAYGGVNDACATRTDFEGNGSATATNRFGAGTYGDCRNNPGSNDYGYLYNWQAAMQDTTAYYDNDYTGPQSNVQGLCPSGWILPAALNTGYKGSFNYLNAQAGNPQTGFWQKSSDGGWLGVYNGACYANGNLYGQTSFGLYWSSTQESKTKAYFLNVNPTSVYTTLGSSVFKFGGRAIRCVHL